MYCVSITYFCTANYTASLTVSLNPITALPPLFPSSVLIDLCPRNNLSSPSPLQTSPSSVQSQITCNTWPSHSVRCCKINNLLTFSYSLSLYSLTIIKLPSNPHSIKLLSPVVSNGKFQGIAT